MKWLIVGLVALVCITQTPTQAEVTFSYSLSDINVQAWPTNANVHFGSGKGNGHYYTKVRVTLHAGEQLTWEDASQFSETLSYHGFQGYLYTPNSNDELNFMEWSNRIRTFGFVGGKRNAQGQYEWLAGPEAGDPVTGVRWAAGEPDGSNDCLWAHPNSGLFDDRCALPYPTNSVEFLVEFGTAPRGLPQGEHVTYFDTESEWAAAVVAGGGNVISFNTHFGFSMPKADEISSPPGTNTALGPQLTFRRENTGLPLDFQLRALSVNPSGPNRALVFDDNEPDASPQFPIHQSLISIGDINGIGDPTTKHYYENDDFEVSVTNRRGQVFAIGLTVYANRFGDGETLKIYGENGVLLDELTYGLPSRGIAPEHNNYAFMGIVSDVPVSRIAFDERDDWDDIAVRNFRFGVGDLECVDCTSCTSGLCEAVPDDFIWDRSEDWALGANDPVNPALDQNGCPVWSYEWTQGDGLDSPAPWYLNATTKMLWDDSWYEGGIGLWTRGDNYGPQAGASAITHIITGAHSPNIPVLRWKNCTEGVEEICVNGELVVFWVGSGGAGSPVDVDVVIAHVGAGDGTTTPLLSMTVSKPTNNEEGEQLTIPVSLQQTVGPGDQLLISHRARNSILARWIPLQDRLTISICGEQFGSIAGRVVADCPEEGTGLYGVVVDVFEAGTGDLADSDTTDAIGQFEFEEIEAGDYTLSFVTPLGYGSVVEEANVTVAGGAAATVDFSLNCADITPDARTIGFWKHQVGVATGGKGRAHIDGDALCSYLDLVELHFNSNVINEVIIYDPPASGECADKLLVAKELLNLKGNVGMTARARQQLTALLLNVASERLSLTALASEDSATVSQAITYCDLLLDDLDDRNDETAKTVADEINNGRVLAAGVIPSNIENIAYSSPADPDEIPSHFGLDGAHPNPFNPQTNVVFSLPNMRHVRLAIYDVRGRLVQTLVNATKPAGRHSVTWYGRDSNGSPAASGVYFVRLEAGRQSDTRKIVLLK